ncbi:hypothetical protein SD960_08410 [Flavobacterium sp. MMLR14_040]|uniref:hypothetical protein n=1 Tax=Flavobacterium sp. MMLR14_040 TaxID=3093843 RepID=UPI002990302F|nr:hypothetical protein [Flavobacterium sp. MMLR14_040]MDW8850109.1 hypothetical protein [Flavobacterium sp. MMLR14_040]
MFYKKIIFVWALFNTCLSHTQTVSEVFQKFTKQYTNTLPLQYKSTYTLYKDFDSEKAEQIYKGVFYKNAKNEVYTKIANTETLNSKTVYLKINHDEKAMEISNPIVTSFGDFDIKPLLDLCKIEKFIDYKTYWEITLQAKTYSGLPYSKIIVQISKDFFLLKQTFYYSTAINFSQDYRKPDPHYPRLEITNTNYNRNPVNAAIFTSNTYFSTSDKKQIILSEPLKKYEVTDQRTITNK